MDLLYNAGILIIIALIWTIIIYLALKGKIGKQTRIDQRMLMGGFLLFVALIAIFVVGTAVFEEVESPEFCGTFCHVMEPYYESYIDTDNPMMSAHFSEHITCSNCHNEPAIIGTIKGLLAAAPEAYAYYTGSYDPDHLGGHVSREACLKCHDGNVASIAGEVILADGTVTNPHDNIIGCSECHVSHYEGVVGMTKEACSICHGTNMDNYEEKLANHAKTAGNDCMDCHNRDHPQDAKIPFSDYPSLTTTKFCSDCHEEEYERFRSNIHSYLDSLNGKNSSCIMCHSEHATLSVEFENCDRCHNPPAWHNIELGGCLYCHNTSLIHSKEVYDPEAKDKPIPTETCLECHEGNAVLIPGEVITTSGDVTNPHLDKRDCSDCHIYHHEGFSGLDDSACSICHGTNIDNFEEKLADHALRTGQDCMDCHNRNHPDDARIPFATYPSLITIEFCSDCHEEEYSAYISSFTPKALEIYGKNGCIDCHPEHKTTNAPHQITAPYDECINCHSNYNTLGIHTRSKISYLGVPFIGNDLCFSCHKAEVTGYNSGIHSHIDCIVCHNEHTIIKVEFADCDKCHTTPTWHDSTVDRCTDCHSIDEIH